MTYRSLMVHLPLGQSHAGLLQVAGGLAEQFDAHVVGVAACQPMQIIYADGCYVSADVVQQEHDAMARQIDTAEAEFRHALHGRASTVEWRSASTIGPLPDYIASQARRADLVITAAAPKDAADVSRRVDIGDLVMQMGRPVLIVPAETTALSLDHAVVCWKDTREARRAAAEALPLLKRAQRVSMVAIVEAEALVETQAHLADVVAWLGGHGVAARPLTLASDGHDSAQLAAVAKELGASLMVAGAYGHSRFSEWVLGGVTRDVLLQGGRCALVAH